MLSRHSRRSSLTGPAPLIPKGWAALARPGRVWYSVRMTTITKVHVLTIEHRHGVNVYVHASAYGAGVALLDFIDEWWNTEFDEDVEKPDDPDALVAAYFEGVESESYSITEEYLRP